MGHERISGGGPTGQALKVGRIWQGRGEFFQAEGSVRHIQRHVQGLAPNRL